MIQATLKQIANTVSGIVVGGSAAQAQLVCGAEFDSRRVQPGQIFCALAGASAHGHKYINEVAKAGAVAAIVEDAQFLEQAKLPGVVVADSLAALQALGAWWRKEVGLPLLAITGSVGKTTTKEIAATILSRLGKGTFSHASFNNQVGVPYTLLQIARDDAWAVIEIGMNHRGEIAPLSRLAAPDVAVVTMIAPAHIGNLGSLRAIAQEKLDIAAGLSADGTLVLNADAELLRDESLLAAVTASIRRRYFGSSGGELAAKLALEVFSVAPTASGITCEVGYQAVERGAVDPASRTQAIANDRSFCFAPLFGEHNATNVAAALLGCLTLLPGLDLQQACAAIADLRVPEQRCVRLQAAAGGGEIFDDSYNANPASMRAFFDATRPFCVGKQSWGVILGEMRELGEFATNYHRELAQLVASLSPSFVIAVGEHGALEYEKILAHSPGILFARSPDALAAVTALAGREYEVLLVKGARGLNLERLVQAIAKR